MATRMLLVCWWLLRLGPCTSSSSPSSDDETALSVGTDEHLFVDDMFTAQARGVMLTMHPPVKTGEILIAPDKPWERVLWWYTTILKVSETDYRLYYDTDGPAGRFLCVALSPDGISNWTKPALDIVPFYDNVTGINHSHTNILNTRRSGTTFIDTNPKVPASQRFKTIIPGGTVYSSADGFRWEVLSTGHIPYSDTQPVAFWDESLAKYRIYMRNHDRGPRRCIGGAPSARSIGLLLVDDLAAPNWGPWDHQEDRNTTIFKVDASDADCLDIYTNMCTRVADSFFIFPIMYLHCVGPVPGSHSGPAKVEKCAYNFGNEGCASPASYLRAFF